PRGAATPWQPPSPPLCPYTTLFRSCNRTEIYCAARPEVAEPIPSWLADFNSLEANELRPHVYQYNKDLAVRHAFRVASGLDSMVDRKSTRLNSSHVKTSSAVFCLKT